MKLRPITRIIIGILFLTTIAFSVPIFAQDRLERPPTYDLEGTPAIRTRNKTIPEGTLLVVEMETPLSSKYSRVSDIFKARTATPILDQNGGTLIPTDSLVFGRVTAVKPAKWPRRSGSISITFEKLQLEDGREYRLNGDLRAAERQDDKLLDDEGNVKAKGTVVRDVSIVGGGAGTGAVVGAVTGGALMGAGIGAAAGATVMLLMKGKDAELKPGHRIGLQLSTPLRLGSSGRYDSYKDDTYRNDRDLGSRPATRPKRSTGGYTGGSSSGRPSYNGSTTGASSPALSKNNIPPNAIPVDVSYARAERFSDGLVRILVTAQTPGTGWRVYTAHALSNDTVEVRLGGVPPLSAGSGQLSHPIAPTIVIPDASNFINRVIVIGRNGSREFKVNDISGPAYSSGARTTDITDSTSARPARRSPAYRPPARRPANTTEPNPTSPSTRTPYEVAGLAEQARFDFAGYRGVTINSNGSYNLGDRSKLSNDDRTLLDALWSLQSSLRAYGDQQDPSLSPTNAAKIWEDNQEVRKNWNKIKMTPDLNQKFTALFQGVDTLVGKNPINVTPPSGRDPNPPTNPSNTSNPPTGGESSMNVPAAAAVAGLVQQVRLDYGASVGVWINPDGTYDPFGNKRPTSDQTQFLDGLGSLLNSIKALGNSSNPSSQAPRLREDIRKVEQLSSRLSFSQDLGAKVRKMLQDSKTLADSV